MSLIERESLKRKLGITGTAESCKGCQYNELWDFACSTDKAPNFAYVCEQIDDAPMVDALPVEFVQKLFAESADFICDELTTIDRDWCERFCYHVEPQGSCFLKYYEEIWLPKQKGKRK